MVFIVDKHSVHMQVPDSTVLAFSKNFSLQVWVNPETWSDVLGWQREPGWPALLAKTRSWCDGFGIYGSKHGHQHPTIYMYVNEWNKFYVKCPVPLQTWSCLLMTYEWQEDSGTLSLYLNGEFVMEEKDLPPMRRNDAPLCIGATRWGEAGWYAWHGSIGPLSIWNRTLKGSEVVKAMRESSNMQSGKVLHLSMREKSGTEINDSSSNGLHAQIIDSMTQIDRSSLPPFLGDETTLPWQPREKGFWTLGNIVLVGALTAVSYAAFVKTRK